MTSPGVRPRRTTTAVTLAIYVVVFTTLCVSSYGRKSATYDEPLHLATGFAALRLHDYRLHPESPPFLRMWAALPLLAMRDVHLNTESPTWTGYPRVIQFRLVAHEFLYRDNDADRLLGPARFMILLLGVGLGIVLFAWAREHYGFATAAVVLACYAVDPNVLAHSGVVTTDMGVTCFIVCTLYFLWRTARVMSVPNLLGLAMSFALAQVSKASAIFLVPLAMVLLGLRCFRRDAWAWRFGRTGQVDGRLARAGVAAGIVSGLVVIGFVAIWAVYGFRYLPTPSGAWRFQFDRSAAIAPLAPRWAVIVRWVDERRLLPNAYSQGFLLEQSRSNHWPSFFAGRYGDQGWWDYFLVALLIKTPMALVALVLAGYWWTVVRPLRYEGAIAIRGRDRAFWHTEVFFVLPALAGLGVSLAATLCIGLRHVLPIYAVHFLIAGKAIQVIRRRAGGLLLAPIVALALVEPLLVWPDYLAFFNGFIGGPSHGHAWLLDSNIDWGQDLKELKRWMDARAITHINLSYLGVADPRYYGIDCTYLLGSPFFANDEVVTEPRLPGYVAISVTNLYGVYFPPAARQLYREFRESEPVAVIGHSIFVYWRDA